MKKIFIITILAIVSYGSTYAQSDKTFYDEFQEILKSKYSHLGHLGHIEDKRLAYKGPLVYIDNRYIFSDYYVKRLKSLKMKDVKAITYYVDEQTNGKSNGMQLLYPLSDNGTIMVYTKKYYLSEDFYKSFITQIAKKSGFKLLYLKPDEKSLEDQLGKP